MDLKKYDEKLVRVKTDYNEVFEGYCVYNDREYNEFEFGINEESLFLQGYIIIKKSEIEEISIIKEYSSPYGLAEEIIVEDGIDIIEDVVEYDETFLPRILNCIKEKEKKQKLNIDYERLNKIIKRIEK